MKLYIPNLGDKLRLTQDWTFRLYYESRNSSLLSEIFDNTPIFFDYCPDKISISDYNRKFLEELINRKLIAPEYVMRKIWIAELKIYKHIEVSIIDRQLLLNMELYYTIPAGSILTVDRIYIRKGQGSFNSLSFRYNKKRFWVNLSDVNNIEFER